MTVPSRLVCFLLLIGLGACASSPPAPQRYLLPEATGSAAANSQREHVLALQDIRLASFLDGEGVVLQLDDITLNAAGNHRWAEPLAQQLQRGLRQRLERQLPDTILVDGSVRTAALQLRIDVDRFHGRYDGVAVAGGRWQLRAADGALLGQENFAVEVRLDRDGYPALVRALGEALDRVAGQVAEACRRLRPV